MSTNNTNSTWKTESTMLASFLLLLNILVGLEEHALTYYPKAAGLTHHISSCAY